LLELEKAKEKEEKDKNQKFFIDPVTHKPFDPVKKFGMIEGENELVYDDMTTSYQLNLPAEYYLKMIQAQLPTKEQKWFIRPHHIESITNHHNSIKDELLNTRYFKHHNNDYNKEPEVNDKEECLNDIRKQVQQLKL